MLKRLSIWNKLALVLWGSALLVFLIAGGGLLLYQHLTLEARVQEIMAPYAQLVAIGTESAVAFQDSARAQEVLDGLRANPDILAAQIVLDDGQALAGFGAWVGSPADGQRPVGIHLSDDRANLTQDLPGEGALR